MKKSAVCGIIFNNQLLLLKRKGKIQGWCLPGGKVDPGENFFEASIRETFEETGIQINIPSYAGESVSSNKEYLCKVYYIPILEKPEVKLSEDEHSEYRWVAFQELGNFELAGNTKNFIDLIFQSL
jgi:8-oxo-dGTP diphosphatase